MRCARRLALVVLAASVVGCWTGRVHRIPDTETRYDTLPDDTRHPFGEARDLLDAGQAASAAELFGPLVERHPENIVLGVWLQEAELAVVGADAQLRRSYRERAERDPTATNLVLAARVEPDPLAARLLLERAAERDPRCAWAHYGQAFLAAKTADWPEVRRALALAKTADAGHMPTRWLEAWMLARGGSGREAIAAFETWIEKARDDRRLDRRLTLEAELDLALLALLGGDPKRARKLLAELDDPAVDQGRRWTAVASAQHAVGDPRAALAAAEEAEQRAPEELLPLVQQALLYDLSLHDRAAAEAAWTRVLALSRGSPDLKALLEGMRARVRLERYGAVSPP